MTPRLVRRSALPEGSAHLTERQFGDLLADPAAVTSHLIACDHCSKEIDALRDSIALFRDASRAYANDQLRRLPEVKLPAHGLISPVQQSAWWLAAAALLLTALSPLQIQRLYANRGAAVSVAATSSAVATKSDEALLDDVDREASATLPSPMYALANPSASLDNSIPPANQRKD